MEYDSCCLRKQEDILSERQDITKFTEKFLWVLWKPTLMLLVIVGTIFRTIFMRAKCLWLSTKKKAQIFETWKDSYVTKLIYKSLPIFFLPFLRVLVKEITAVKKNNDFDVWQRRILYADFLNEPSYAFMPQADR